MAFCFFFHSSAFSLMLPICGLNHCITKSNKENKTSVKIQIFFTIKTSKFDLKCNTSSYLIQTRGCFYLQQTCYEIQERPIAIKKYYCPSRYLPALQTQTRQLSRYQGSSLTWIKWRRPRLYLLVIWVAAPLPSKQ